LGGITADATPHRIEPARKQMVKMSFFGKHEYAIKTRVEPSGTLSESLERATINTKYSTKKRTENREMDVQNVGYDVEVGKTDRDVIKSVGGFSKEKWGSDTGGVARVIKGWGAR